MASFGGIVSLVPNRAALIEAMHVAGFADVGSSTLRRT